MIVQTQKQASNYSPLHIFGRVFRNRKEELLITVGIMLLLMVFSAVMIYFLERKAQPEAFGHVGSAMWWAVAALTTVGYGDVYPITVAGKVFAAVIAMCGIGMFALPAGILGGGFVEEIEEEKKRRQNLKNAEDIKAAFEVENLIRVRKFKKARGIESPRKSIELVTLQNELQLTADEVFHAIKSADGLRLRNIQSTADSQYDDMVVIERFPHNTTYGSHKEGRPELTVINSAAESEVAVGHFTETLAAHLGASYISNEYFSTGAMRRDRRTNFGINAAYLEGNRSDCDEFEAFKADCRTTAKQDEWVIIIFSAARHRAGISLATGGKAGEPCDDHDSATVNDLGRIKAFRAALAETMIKTFDSTVAAETAINDHAPNRLCQFIRTQTGANVLSLRINIELLRWSDMESYYALVAELSEAIETHLLQSET